MIWASRSVKHFVGANVLGVQAMCPQELSIIVDWPKAKAIMQHEDKIEAKRKAEIRGGEADVVKKEEIADPFSWVLCGPESKGVSQEAVLEQALGEAVPPIPS